VSSRVDALRVYECTRPLRRVGRPNDGGYVIAWGVEYDHFLSGGIGDDNSFERGILDEHTSLVCDAFDPASDGGPVHPGFRFHQEKLGYLGFNACRNALVKIDIEGDEWPWLGHAPMSLKRIAQLVIELHSPHLGRWAWEVLYLLNETHALIHAHANNMDGMVEIDGVRVPGTIECTYLRRDLAGTLSPNRTPIPGPLDMPNDPRIPDHVIDWEPFVTKPFDDFAEEGC
jgi:hypothetical protein